MAHFNVESEDSSNVVYEIVMAMTNFHFLHLWFEYVSFYSTNINKIHNASAVKIRRLPLPRTM